MNEKECKREIYDFDSRLLIRNSGAIAFVEHALPQDVVRSGLITFAPLFQPGDHVGVEAHGDGLLEWPIESAADCIFPCIGRQLSEVSIWSSGIAARAASSRFWRGVSACLVTLCLFTSVVDFLIAFGIDCPFRGEFHGSSRIYNVVYTLFVSGRERKGKSKNV